MQAAWRFRPGCPCQAGSSCLLWCRFPWDQSSRARILRLVRTRPSSKSCSRMFGPAHWFPALSGVEATTPICRPSAPARKTSGNSRTSTRCQLKWAPATSKPPAWPRACPSCQQSVLFLTAPQGARLMDGVVACGYSRIWRPASAQPEGRLQPDLPL